MKPLRIVCALFTAVLLSGCKVQVTVPEGGRVETESDAYVCESGETCVIDVNDTFFDETFTAVPDQGYKFVRWKKVDRGFFGGSTDSTVRLFTSGFVGNDALLGILESDRVFFLEPVFNRSNTWAAKAEMKTNRAEFSGCSIKGKIYVIGGRIGPTEARSEFTSKVEQYNPKTDVWTLKAEVPTPRKHTTASPVNGKCYVIGGQSKASGSSGPAISTVEAYDPATNTWSRRSDMPTARFSAASAVVNDKIYVVGGSTGFGQVVATLEVYDPATDTWDSKASMPTARGALGAATVKGKIYAVGGGQYFTQPAFDTMEQYDPASDSWSILNPLPTGKYALSVVALNNRIYALGGFSNYWRFDRKMYAYNPATNEWESRRGLPSQRAVFVALPAGGKIYVSGGIIDKPSPAIAITDEYTP